MDLHSQQMSELKRRKGRLWQFIFKSLIIVIVFLIGGGIIYVKNSLKPVASKNENVQIVIEKGMGTAQIADLLEQKKLIRNAQMFKYYLKFKGKGNQFKAGQYTLKVGLTIDEIIAVIEGGKISEYKQKQFTIPEGWNVEQMANRLSEKGYVNKEVFLNLAKGNTIQVGHISQIPNNPSMKYRLEGYLFPDTYSVKKGATEQHIIEMMALELENKLQSLPDGWEQQLTKHNVSFHEMMTIASLVEREAVVDEERAIIAGVIYNRLQAKMKLEIDATVQYVFGEQKERLVFEDLKIDSPYNTYKITTLPPGPISSPSIKSIQAALYPQSSNYFFYVTKKDGSHAHYFGETYEQHLQNIEKSKQEAKK